MNLIPYSIFVYINYVIFLSIAGLGWLISSTSVEINTFLSIAGLAGIVVLFLSKNKEFPPISVIEPRLALLFIFLALIIISFSHYFFQVDNSNLILLVLIAPALSLLSMIFVDTEQEKDN